MSLMLYRTLGVVALVAAIYLQAPAAAWSAKDDVTVHRGATAFSAEMKNGVEVIRGPAVPVQRYNPSRAMSGTIRAVAGEHLWLINDAGDRLTNCRVRRTTQVGRSVIRCQSRSLPRAD